EVEVGEEGPPLAQHGDLLRLRLLHLQHELGPLEDIPRLGHDGRALCRVLLVGDQAAVAGAGLDDRLVAVDRELAHARGRDRDAVLVRLYLGWDADLQCFTTRSQASVRTSRRIAPTSSTCSVSAISGGESWITGSPRSSARQIRPRR